MDRDRRLKDRPAIMVVKHERAISLRRDIAQVCVHRRVGTPSGDLDDGVNIIPTEISFIRQTTSFVSGTIRLGGGQQHERF
jgi:hypothetical protein